MEEFSFPVILYLVGCGVVLSLIAKRFGRNEIKFLTSFLLMGVALTLNFQWARDFGNRLSDISTILKWVAPFTFLFLPVLKNMRWRAIGYAVLQASLAYGWAFLIGLYLKASNYFEGYLLILLWLTSIFLLYRLSMKYRNRYISLRDTVVDSELFEGAIGAQGLPVSVLVDGIEYKYYSESYSQKALSVEPLRLIGDLNAVENVIEVRQFADTAGLSPHFGNNIGLLNASMVKINKRGALTNGQENDASRRIARYAANFMIPFRLSIVFLLLFFSFAGFMLWQFLPLPPSISGMVFIGLTLTFILALGFLFLANAVRTGKKALAQKELYRYCKEYPDYFKTVSIANGEITQRLAWGRHRIILDGESEPFQIPPEFSGNSGLYPGLRYRFYYLKEINLILSAEQLEETNWEKVETALAQGLRGAYDFSESDIEENRQGRLSQKQKIRLSKRNWLGAFFTLVVTLGCSWAVWDVMSDTLPLLNFCLFLFWVTPIYIGAKSFSELSQEKVVESVEGIPECRNMTSRSIIGRGRPTWMIVFGKVEISPPYNLPITFVRPFLYRAYYYKPLNRLLSIEPCGRADSSVL